MTDSVDKAGHVVEVPERSDARPGLGAAPPGVDRTAPGAGGPAEAFSQAVAIMARLRGLDGCPWDREQDFDSIRKHTIEEAYEVLDAIERRNWPDLKDELGDLLLQVLFYSQMAGEAGRFTIEEVISGLNRKLIRRHPHVFGDEASREAGNSAAGGLETRNIGSQEVLQNWEAIKQAEKQSQAGQLTSHASEGRLASVPRSTPALMEAAKLGSRAAKAGFDWPDVEGLFAKIDEETKELRDAIAIEKSASSTGEAAVNEELGDLLFTVVNLARHLKVDAELALRGTNEKFRRRFAAMETCSSLPLEELAPHKLEDYWALAKLAEEPGETKGR